MKLGSVIQRKNLLLTLIILMLLVSITIAMMVLMVNVTSAFPATYFYVDPQEVRDVQPSDTFLITINVTEAPPSYAWEVYLSWDPALLELVNVAEGDFLHRWDEPFPGWIIPKYDTILAHVPLDEANLRGEILVGCSLIGALPIDEWASGDGWLVTIGFLVKAEGSTLINLYRTRLLDHMEAEFPASTYYPNNDGFFYNVHPSHDIRIIDVAVLTPEAPLGEVANINVTVLNEGTATESFTLNVKANETVIDTTVLSLNGTGNFENRSFTYEASWDTRGFTQGAYTISAEVPPVGGEVDTADNALINGTVTITRPPGAPVAAFTFSPESPQINEEVTFDASASYDPDGTIVSYFWDFGDGTNAAGVTVDHAYADEDVYMVTLTVTDDDGLTGSATAYVRVRAVVPSIALNPTSGPIGTKLTVSGFGFVANMIVTVTFDDMFSAVWVMTDGNGSFTTVLNVPISAAGPHSQGV